jgi:Phage integrase family/Hexapeptide repeat of succinyl-transferase
LFAADWLFFTSEQYDRDHAALAVLLGLNGLRVSEACATNIEERGIEPGHRTLRIMGKGTKPTTVPLASRTARTIDLAVGERHDGPIPRRRDGHRLDRRTAHRRVHSIGKRAGLGAVHPHMLRAAFIMAALDAGLPLRDVQIVARHADARTTTIYDWRRQTFDRHAAYVVVAFVAGGLISAPASSGTLRVLSRPVERRRAGGALRISSPTCPARCQDSTVESSEVARAIDSAISIAVALDLPADDAVVLQNSNKLAVRLLPCDVFARVAAAGRGHAAFEVELAQRLAATESGVGIGGVLEPPQAAPVIIEDGAFIGSRAMVTEGARVGTGALLGAGVVLNPSIPVIDGETGEEVSRGVVPPWCLVINATRPKDLPGGTFGFPCALIIRRFAEGERHDKATLNTILREHGIAT